MRSSTKEPPLGRYGDLAFILTVVVAYVATFLASIGSFDLPVMATLLGLGLLYTAIGTVGTRIFDRLNSVPWWLLFFGIEILLAMAILTIGSFFGTFWIITLPLVSQSVIALPRRWSLLVCAMVVAFGFTIPLSWIGGWETAFQNTLFFLAGVVFVALFTEIAVREGRARAEVEHLAGELARANEQLRLQAAQAEELATAKERNRLAREIHDSLGHYLTVINVQLEAAAAVFSRDPQRSVEAMLKAQSLAREGLADVRLSIAALRASPEEDRPLTESLESLVADCRAAGLVAGLEISGTVRRLSAQAERALFRAAQEGLTNVRKHARASRCDVRLEFGTGAARLTIQDNGVGQAAEEGAPGFGLVGVRERAALLGGTVRIETTPGSGFRLEVEVPG
jgi:signal transduction histidine kinase